MKSERCGDAGVTDATRPSRRISLELGLPLPKATASSRTPSIARRRNSFSSMRGLTAPAQPPAAARRSDSLATPSIRPLIARLIAATTAKPTTGRVGCVRTA